VLTVLIVHNRPSSTSVANKSFDIQQRQAHDYAFFMDVVQLSFLIDATYLITNARWAT